MKWVVYFFVAFAIALESTQNAVSASDTARISVAKVDSSKVPAGIVAVDKEAFTIALQSANTTIEFLKFFLTLVVSIGTLIIAGLTAYFAWQSYQNKNRIIELENRLQQADLGITQIEAKAGTLATTFQAIETKISQITPPASEQTMGLQEQEEQQFTPTISEQTMELQEEQQ